MLPNARFSIVVCKDGNVFVDEIREQIEQGNGVFVTIPVRLGLEAVQPEYLPCIKEMFQFESNCGVAGGQLHKAYYFVGILNP